MTHTVLSYQKIAPRMSTFYQSPIYVFQVYQMGNVRTMLSSSSSSSSLLLYCFTSTVNSYGHVGAVS